MASCWNLSRIKMKSKAMGNAQDRVKLCGRASASVLQHSSVLEKLADANHGRRLERRRFNLHQEAVMFHQSCRWNLLNHFWRGLILISLLATACQSVSVVTPTAVEATRTMPSLTPTELNTPQVPTPVCTPRSV